MANKNEIYKNTPLVETVFEIRFSGEPAVECNRDKFYDKLRDVYPKVSVPKALQGTALALQPYSFDDNDGNSGVRTSINSMAVYTKQYKSFPKFKEETMRVFSIFGELFTIQKLNRTGLRYINVIPFTRTKNTMPMNDYLNIDIRLPDPISTDFKDLNLIFISETAGGMITTRIEPAVSQDKSQEVIILDFDYAKVKDLDFGSIGKYLDESHQHTKEFFHALITDNYKKVMRGEVIK